MEGSAKERPQPELSRRIVFHWVCSASSDHLRLMRAFGFYGLRSIVEEGTTHVYVPSSKFSRCRSAGFLFPVAAGSAWPDDRSRAGKALQSAIAARSLLPAHPQGPVNSEEGRADGIGVW